MEVKNEAVERELLDEGTYNAICVSVIDQGTQKTSWQGKEKEAHKISLTFEIQDELDSEGNPFYMYKTYTLSLAPKSNFAKDLKTWKGIVIPKGKSYNIDELLGQPALVTVTHTEKDDGAVYANITNVSAPMKGTKFRKPKAELVGFYMDEGSPLDKETFDGLNQWLQDRISASPEFLALVQKSRSTKAATTGKKPARKK